jgi:hypothetical protein
MCIRAQEHSCRSSSFSAKDFLYERFETRISDAALTPRIWWFVGVRSALKLVLTSDCIPAGIAA